MRTGRAIVEGIHPRALHATRDTSLLDAEQGRSYHRSPWPTGRSRGLPASGRGFCLPSRSARPMRDALNRWTELWDDVQALELPSRRMYSPMAEDNIHRYPAKMFPPLAQVFLNHAVAAVGKRPRQLLFFDPCCGSGTTILFAKLLGMRVAGSDLLKMATVVTEAKTNVLSESALVQLGEASQLSASELEMPTELDSWQYRELWFDDAVYRTLMSLRHWVSQVAGRDFFPHAVTALGQVVWDVSAADPDVIVPTRSRHSPGPPKLCAEEVIEAFRKRAARIVRAQEALRRRGLSRRRTSVSLGDMKDASTWPVRKFDVVLCSPPYGDGIDYRRAVSLQHRFFGFQDEFVERKLTERMIGRRSYLSCTPLRRLVPEAEMKRRWLRTLDRSGSRRAKSLATYLQDMRQSLRSLGKGVSNDGLIGMVLGEPEMAGVRVPLAKLVSYIALGEGLVLTCPPGRDRIRKRSQTPVRRSSKGPISREYLLQFKRAEPRRCAEGQ